LIFALLLGLTGEFVPARAMNLQAGTALVANNDTFGFKIGTTYSTAVVRSLSQWRNTTRRLPQLLAFPCN